MSLGGVLVDPVDSTGAVEWVLDALDHGDGGMVVTPNLDHLRMIASGSPLANAYRTADLVLPDGMPLVWVSRLQRTPLPERVAGSTFLWQLSEAAAGRASVFLVGGQPAAADTAAQRLASAAPGLEVAGTACPPLGFEEQPEERDRLVKDLRTAGPDIVFLGLGAPKQELLAVDLRRQLPDSWIICVGAAIDMAAGYVQRAPQWMQRAGMEWVWRLGREPRRLFRRYVVDDLPFALALFARVALAAGRRRAAPPQEVAGADTGGPVVDLREHGVVDLRDARHDRAS